MPGPRQIKCDIGHEWRDPEEFSKRQLENYRQRLRRRVPGVSPANSGIKCIEHNGEIAKELQCKGPCQKWLTLGHFSKSTRDKNRNVCMKCTEWQTTQEPGTAPYVAPNNVRSVQEKLWAKVNTPSASREPAVNHPFERSDMSVLEGVKMSDFGDLEGSDTPPAVAISASNASDNASTSASHESSHQAASVQGSYNSTEDSRPTFSFDGELDADRFYDQKTSSGYDTSSQKSTATINTNEQTVSRAGRIVQHNAWGPDGQMHVRQTAVSVVSESAVSVTVSTTLGVTRKAQEMRRSTGWDRVAGRKTEHAPPSYIMNEGYLEPTVEYEDDAEFSEDEC